MSNIIGNHVAGSRLSQKGGSLQDVFNPSTGDVSGQIRLSSAAELDDVVKVASEAASRMGGNSSDETGTGNVSFQTFAGRKCR